MTLLRPRGPSMRTTGRTRTSKPSRRPFGKSGHGLVGEADDIEGGLYQRVTEGIRVIGEDSEIVCAVRKKLRRPPRSVEHPERLRDQLAAEGGRKKGMPAIAVVARFAVEQIFLPKPCLTAPGIRVEPATDEGS